MLTSTATTAMLRSSITRRTCALQPLSLLRAATAATGASSSSPYSTLPPATATFSVRAKLPSTRPCLLPTAKPSTTVTTTRTTVLLHFRRHASTDSKAAPATAQDAGAPPTLDWNTFFALRKTRRRWQVAFSVVMSLVGGTAATAVLSSGVADSLTSEVPLDPFLTLGLVTLGFIALGWLVGPSLGNALFYLAKSKYKAPMTVVCDTSFVRDFSVEGTFVRVAWCADGVRCVERKPVLCADQEEPR